MAQSVHLIRFCCTRYWNTFTSRTGYSARIAASWPDHPSNNCPTSRHNHPTFSLAAQSSRFLRLILSTIVAIGLHGTPSRAEFPHFDPGDLRVPLKGSATFNVHGELPRVVRFKVDDPAIASVRLNRKEGLVTIFGKRKGDTHISLFTARWRSTRLIKVRPSAGKLPSETFSFSVSGESIPTHVIAEYACLWVSHSPSLPSDARLEIVDDMLFSGPPLKAGEERFYRIPLRMERGEDYYPVQAFLSGKVKNIELKAENADRLFISNDPEAIHQKGILFQTDLTWDDKVRLLYHHQAPRSDVTLRVIIRNGELPAEILLRPGLAVSESDGIQVGHQSTLKYLRQFLAQSFLRVSLLPGETWELAHHHLASEEVVSGLMDAWLLNGSSAELFIISGENLTEALQAGRIAPLSRNGRLSGQVFGSPNLVERYRFPLNKESLDIRIGDLPGYPASQSEVDLHLGNYGVIYEGEINIENPLNQAATVRLSVVAHGGTARVALVLDGEIKETPYLDATENRPYALAEFPLASHEKRTVHTLTIPEAGSYLPFRLVWERRL